MSERRSGRSRKQVDYTKFEADNDDDFADPSLPPPKKKKKTEKPDGHKEKDKPPRVTSDKSAGRKERLPLEEKLYERDLQAALEISLQASQSQPDADDKGSATVNSHAVLHSTPVSSSSNDLVKTDMPEESQSIMPSAIPHSVAADDNIEFLGTVACSDPDSPSNKRRAATKKKKTYTCDDDEDESTDNEDFSDGQSESESDFSDADSDFDEGKVKAKSKKKVKGKAAPTKTKSPTATGRNLQSATKRDRKAVSVKQTSAAPKPATTVPSKVGTSVKSSAGTVRGEPSVTPSPASSRVPIVPQKPPAWTPPGHSDGNSSSISLKSPSSGLRLGLSRHARIKPLHPSLKVS